MRQRGFSILEAIVAVTVMGLLVAVTLPSASAWMRNLRLRNVADGLQAGLQQARNEAVRRNTPVSLWLVSTSDPAKMDSSCALSSTSGAWVVSVNSPAGACDTESTIVATHPLGDAAAMVKIQALQADAATAGTTVTFNGFGQVSNADAIASVAVDSAVSGPDYRKLRIVISSVGRVFMCDALVTDPSDPRKCP
jgi:type IV fimbrial biogenesis protein FimT